MDIGNVVSGFGSVLSVAAGGGIFGIIGGLFQKGLDAYHESQQAQADLAILKEKNAQELALRDKDRQMVLVEAQNALALAQVNANKDVDVASYAALGQSYEGDKATYATGSEAANSKLFIFVDFVRGMTRPVLTSYMAILFTIMAAYITYQVFHFAPELLKDLTFIKTTFKDLIDATIFMTTTVILWWFAARGMISPRDK